MKNSYRLPLTSKILVIALIVCSPLLLLFQNAAPPTYNTNDLLSYYQNQFALCTSTNNTGCKGEITRFIYERGENWGVGPFCPSQSAASMGSPSPGGPNTPVISYGIFYGCNFKSPVFGQDISQKIVYRNTGVYVTNYKNRDVRFDPGLIEEYSYAYDPATGTTKTGPLRQVTRSYYYNTSPIPGNAEGLSYNTLGLVKQSTTVNGSTTKTTYLPSGKINSTVKNGIEQDFTYDSGGNLYQTFDWRDGVQKLKVTYSNYLYGQPQLTTYPDGSTRSQVNNPDGTIASTTDGLLNTTSYSYDSLLRTTKITPPISAITTIDHPDDLTTIATKGTLQTTKVTDALGRILSTKVADLNGTVNPIVSTKTYDDDSRIIFSSFAGFNAASTYGTRIDNYDVLDRVLSSTNTATNATTTTLYNSPDTTIVTKPTGETSTQKYLSYGSPNSNILIEKDENLVVNPTTPDQTIVTKMYRDAEGKLIEANQAGVFRRFTYDSSQRLSQIIEPERAPITYTYYGGSALLKTKTVGTRAPITYLYDDMNRHSQILFNNTNDNVTFTYDFNGNIKTESTPLVSKSFEYNAVGNKSKETMNIDGYSFVVDIAYDNQNRVDSITYPDSSLFAGTPAGSRNKVTYTYDNLNRTTGLSDLSQTIAANITYNPNGQFNSIDYANGLTSKLTLTNDHLPYEIYLLNSSTNVVGLRYKYDLNSNTLSITDLVNSAYTQNFTYDGLDRLTSSNYPTGSSLIPTGSQSANLGGSISYSGTGDILSYTEFAKNATTLTYDQTTQLLSQSTGPQTKNYFYDDYGQMTSNSIYNFNYDPNFNMTSVVNASTNATTANYTYDPGDLRVKKSVTNGTTTYYVYGGEHLALEATPNKNVREYFYLGSNLIGTRVVATNVPTYKYYHFNPLSSNIALSDSTKTVTQEHYNSYGGELVPNSNFTSNIDVRFAGHISDDETNLIYMKGRYYDPSIGRFITPDPQDYSASSTQSFNKYIYANNNPLKYIDPNGHNGFLITFVATIVVGAAVMDYLDKYHPEAARNVDAFLMANPELLGPLIEAGFRAPKLIKGAFIASKALKNPAAAKAAANVATGAPRGDVALAGHGEIRYTPTRDNFTMPQGTTLRVWAEHGAGISDRFGNMIERGATGNLQPTGYYHPGQQVPPYVLHPTGTLNVEASSVTVQTPTFLQDILKPNMGVVDWAACSHASQFRASGTDFIRDGAALYHEPSGIKAYDAK